MALTHFNSLFKTPKELKRFKEYQKYYDEQTLLAFDHLEVPLRENDHLPEISKFISEINDRATEEFLKSGGKGETD